MVILASFIYSKISSRKGYIFSPWPLRLYKETLFAIHPPQGNSRTSNSSSGCKSLICVVSKPEMSSVGGAFCCRQKKKYLNSSPLNYQTLCAVRPRASDITLFYTITANVGLNQRMLGAEITDSEHEVVSSINTSWYAEKKPWGGGGWKPRHVETWLNKPTGKMRSYTFQDNG